MTGTKPGAETTPTVGAAPEITPPLDEIMLAMDVVDTLRHENDLVDRELDEERREQALIARLREIYASQGLDVSDDALRAGVAALKAERFGYRPPPRTFQVRLAELYVRRGLVLVVTVVIAALVGTCWYLATVPAARQNARRMEALVTRSNDARTRLDGLAAEVRALRGRLDAAGFDAAGENGLARESLRLGQLAAGVLAEAEKALARSLADPPPTRLAEDEVVPERLVALEESLRSFDHGAAAMSASLASVARSLDARDRLGSLADSVGRELAASDRPAASDAAKAAVAAARAILRGAAERGDEAATRASVEALQNLLLRIDAAYALRIVSRPNERSGVFRVPDDRPRGRNFYLVVEPVAADGRILALPVTSEEDQTTRVVTRFGLRVAEAVYLRVREDKSDNGIVDDALVGEKRAGDLEPRYRVPVLGGMIYEW